MKHIIGLIVVSLLVFGFSVAYGFAMQPIMVPPPDGWGWDNPINPPQLTDAEWLVVSCPANIGDLPQGLIGDIEISRSVEAGVPKDCNAPEVCLTVSATIKPWFEIQLNHSEVSFEVHKPGLYIIPLSYFCINSNEAAIAGQSNMYIHFSGDWELTGESNIPEIGSDYDIPYKLWMNYQSTVPNATQSNIGWLDRDSSKRLYHAGFCTTKGELKILIDVDKIPANTELTDDICLKVTLGEL